MFDFEDNVMGALLCLVIIFVGILIGAWIASKEYIPSKIKDTNCIYYEEQIYCLKE